jgi:hypothetical protein
LRSSAMCVRVALRRCEDQATENRPFRARCDRVRDLGGH